MKDGLFTAPDTGLEINFRVWEGGEQPMVLVHGLASTLRIWDHVAPLLTEKFTVYAYDQRGHALSGKPDEGYDLETMLSDLRDVIHHFGLENP